MSNKYTGGFWPGETLFAVDGDFTSIDPHGPPVISFPLEGDSIVSKNKIALATADEFAPSGASYELYSPGSGPNFGPWQSNQAVFMLEQEFICSQGDFKPTHLNSTYNPAWSLGWYGQFPDGFDVSSLLSLILVKESPLENIGGGLVKFKRTYVSFPSPRSLPGRQYPYLFPAIGGLRSADIMVPYQVNYRLHETFYLFDYYNVQNWDTIADDGFRINDDTPNWRKYFSAGGIIIPGFRAWNVTNFNIPTQTLIDSEEDDETVPNATDYLAWVSGADDSDNHLPIEIAAENSSFDQWMGNIWVRRTPYIIAQ